MNRRLHLPCRGQMNINISNHSPYYCDDILALAMNKDRPICISWSRELSAARVGVFLAFENFVQTPLHRPATSIHASSKITSTTQINSKPTRFHK